MTGGLSAKNSYPKSSTLVLGDPSKLHPEVTPVECILSTGKSLHGFVRTEQGGPSHYNFTIDRRKDNEGLQPEDLYGLNDVSFNGQVHIYFGWMVSLPDWDFEITREIGGKWKFAITSSISLSGWDGDINPFQFIRFISRDIGKLPGRDTKHKIIWFDSDGHIFINSNFEVPDDQDPMALLRETIKGIRLIFLGFEEIPAIDPDSEYFSGTLSIGRDKGFSIDYARIYKSLSSLVKFRWNKDYHSLGAGAAVLLVWLGSVFVTVYIENLLD